MNDEAALYAAMVAQVAPFNAPVYRLHAPQLDDQQPDQVPYIVFSREAFSDAGIEDFCAADAQLADGYIVDCYALQYAEARELSRQMIAVFKAFGSAVDAVFEDYESSLRIYRVTCSFTLRA